MRIAAPCSGSNRRRSGPGAGADPLFDSRHPDAAVTQFEPSIAKKSGATHPVQPVAKPCRLLRMSARARQRFLPGGAARRRLPAGGHRRERCGRRGRIAGNSARGMRPRDRRRCRAVVRSCPVLAGRGFNDLRGPAPQATAASFRRPVIVGRLIRWATWQSKLRTVRMQMMRTLNAGRREGRYFTPSHAELTDRCPCKLAASSCRVIPYGDYCCK